MGQQRQNDRIAFLASHETAAMPDITIKTRKITRGLIGANMDLKLNEWAYEGHFSGAIIDEDIGEFLEYQD